MHRLLIALLSAFDALIAAATGLAVVLATLTLLWVLGIGAPDWSALWPATAAVWQLGHLVPFTVHLSAEYVAALGIPDAAASFTVSLAPLAFACFTAYRGVRSGIRAGRSGSWGAGLGGGAVAFAIVSAVVCLTARGPVADAPMWQAILLPALVFAVPAAAGVLGSVWRTDAGVIGRLRESIADLPDLWPDVPALALRGAGVALTALVGIGALGVVVALLTGGDRVVALYQSSNADVMGVIVVSLAQLAYLPTFIVWALSFVAGPGFTVGTGTAFSPAGTQSGIIPGIPVLGALPAASSPWLLVLVLLPIGAGVLAGWVLRGRMLDLDASAGVRAGTAGGVAVLTGGGAALAAWVASGAFGPGRLAQIGPQPGWVALAVGVEVLVGAGILLLTPVWEPEPDLPRGDLGRPRENTYDLAETRTTSAEEGAAPADGAGTGATSAEAAGGGAAGGGAAGGGAAGGGSERGGSEDDVETAPIDPGFLGGPDEIKP
ncbi:DUF6350 family protein [Microbacterium horticulturae]|uniref:DUF6350 family protein n=1 Tax=Microbacterium horticulturae TaxID=3028316 RepID=A0ABY8BV70_9MICO|nr:DUF6350 family protein [Microbacterium sp. KACC 23027]WEG08065.1 DUF6350 family protein [Microbacterium sp. KACC 23027]